MRKAIKLVISGRVQGVAYRYYASKQAEELNLVGYVENQKDGSVHAQICGDVINVEKFIKWCEVGSPASQVENVQIETIPELELTNFQIRR